MRILYLHTKYKEYGGEDAVVESEISLLKRNGYEVDVLYFDNKQNSLSNIVLFPFNFISYWKVSQRIQAFKPDVVHLHNLHFAASLSVIWAIRRKKVAMVKTLHNYRFLCPSGTLFHKNQMYLQSIQAKFPWHAVKEKVYRNSGILTFWLAFTIWLHKKLGTFAKVDRYITLTENSRQIFLTSRLQLQPAQVVVKPNFIWPKQTDVSPARGANYLYIGRLSPEKGIDVLLAAFAANGLPLTIIGDGPLRNAVTAYQTQNPKITWLGYQQKDVINKELQSCSALIVPSVCLEGMPLTILEAFATGTPVIASKMGSMEAMISNNTNGLLFLPNNADSLNRQINKWQAFTNAKKREFSVHAFQSYQTQFTPEINVAALVEVYNEAIGKTAVTKRQLSKASLS